MSDRRQFLQTAGALGAFAILKPETVRGSAANSAVRVGLLGCGNRGSTHAANITKYTEARLLALADLYQDRLGKGGRRSWWCWMSRARSKCQRPAKKPKGV